MNRTVRDVIFEALNYDGHRADDVLEALGAAGFVIVPKEPTPEMRDAGMTWIEGDTAVQASAGAKACYLAMIAAKDETYIRDESERLRLSGTQEHKS